MAWQRAFPYNYGVPITIFGCKGVPATRRERIEKAVRDRLMRLPYCRTLSTLVRL
jgi:hypothetical protein